MAPDLSPEYAPDAHFLARMARSKISAETASYNQELRLWVGHTNMLDHLNHIILNAYGKRVFERSLAKTESSIVSVERAPTWAGEPKPHDGQARTVSGPIVCMSGFDEDSSSDKGLDEDQFDLSLQLCHQNSHPRRPIINRITREGSPAMQVTVAEVEVDEFISES